MMHIPVTSNTKRNVLLVVGLAVFIDMFIYGLIVPILPMYATSLGISQTEIGLLFSSYAITLFIATPFLGMISDRIGRKAPLLFGLIGLCVTTLLFIFATSFWMLVLARSLQGIAAAATWTAGLALLAEIHPEAERGKAMGLALSGQAAGTLLGPTIGGWLYEWGGYQLPFLVAAALALLDGIMRITLLKNVPDSHSEASPSPLRVIRNKSLLIIAGVVMIGAMIPTVLEPTLPFHLSQVFGASPGVIGLLFAVPTISYGLFAPLIGSHSTTIGHKKMITMGIMLVAIVLPLHAIANGLWLITGLLALLGVGMGMILAPSLPKMTQLSHESGHHSLGLTFASYNTAYSLGMMLGPLGASVLTDVSSITVAYAAVSLIILFYLFVFRRLH